MSDHPNFAKLKKTTVGSLKPAVKEGYLVKKGADFHTWKKRWFVMKDQYIFYFPKNTDSSLPKGVIELNGNSSASLDLSTKKPTIVINSVHRVQEINSDSEEEARTWVDAINQHILTLKPQTTANEEPTANVETSRTTQPKQVVVSTPRLTQQASQRMYVDLSNDAYSWKEVCIVINENTENSPSKIKQVLLSLGKKTCDLYFYSILSQVLQPFNDDVIALVLYDYFCDGELIDLQTVVAGRQGDSDEFKFIFGKTVEGAKRTADIFKCIIKKHNIDKQEVVRCLLSACVNWELNLQDEFYQEFVIGVTKEWTGIEMMLLFDSLDKFSTKMESTKFESFPEYVVDFVKKLSNDWDDDFRKVFINAAAVTLSWENLNLRKLSNIIYRK